MTQQRPGFLEGVAVAVLASLAGGALYWLLRLVVATPEALAATLAGLGLGYLLYLLRRAAERVGRITAISIWIVATGACAALAPELLLPLQLALIWLVRALYLQPGLLAAAADLGLLSLGLGAALWALSSTGSLAVALWSFFLVQALFPAAADLLQPRLAGTPEPDDRFARAERRASACLRRLASIGSRSS